MPHFTATVVVGPAILLAATGTPGHLAWVLASGLLGLVGVVRVLRRPPGRWKYRNWSKLAWVVAILYVAPSVGGYPIPVGAIGAIFATGRQASVPASAGQPDRPEESNDWPLPWWSK